MRGTASGVLALGMMLQAATPSAPAPGFFRYERTVRLPSGAGATACVRLDATVYAHARPALSDVRLYRGESAEEVPYVLTASQTTATTDPARVLNLGMRGTHIVFDLEMPGRPYSSVNLQLAGRDFLGTARVTAGTGNTALGTYTVFDLTRQKLGRSTVLTLPEASFPVLHVDLALNAAPGLPALKTGPGVMLGAEVPPSREAQALYTTVAETTSIGQAGHNTVATLAIPAHVPVERISFVLDPESRQNFSRSVTIVSQVAKHNGAERVEQERIEGVISRVHATEGAREIRVQNLAIPATLGSNAQNDAVVDIAVLNGDDRPLPLRAVRLEMRERKLCFDDPGQPVTMRYGDSRVDAPAYDYARVFDAQTAARTAELGPEAVNPRLSVRVEQTTFPERHPALLWVVLLGVIAALGFVAIRSAKRV